MSGSNPGRMAGLKRVSTVGSGVALLVTVAVGVGEGVIGVGVAVSGVSTRVVRSGVIGWPTDGSSATGMLSEPSDPAGSILHAAKRATRSSRLKARMLPFVIYPNSTMPHYIITLAK